MSAPARRARAWPLVVVLVASVTVLASMYMPWQQPSCASGTVRPGADPTAGLQSVFACSFFRQDDGRTAVAEIAMLASLLLVLATCIGLARPRLRTRLPL